MNENTNRYFISPDLYLCAFILATEKAKLLNIEGDKKKQAVFVFSDPEICEQLKSDYFSHQALVDPFQMSIALREIKSRLYSAR